MNIFTDLKEIAGALRQVENQLRHCKIPGDTKSVSMMYSVDDRILIENLYKFKNYGAKLITEFPGKGWTVSHLNKL